MSTSGCQLLLAATTLKRPPLEIRAEMIQQDTTHPHHIGLGTPAIGTLPIGAGTGGVHPVGAIPRMHLRRKIWMLFAEFLVG